MITETLYFMPSVVCLMWSFILLLKKRNRPQNYLLLVLAIGTLYYADYAIAVSPSTDYSQMAYLTAINEFIAPAWMVCHFLYLESHLKKTILTNFFIYFALFILPCVHGGIMGAMYYIMEQDEIAALLQAIDETTAQGIDFFANPSPGFDDEVYNLFYFTAEKQYHIICLILCLCTLCMAGIVMYRHNFTPKSLWNFLRGKGAITSGILTSILLSTIIMLQCPLMILGRSYILTSPYLGLTLTLAQSVCIFLLSFVEYMSRSRIITLGTLTCDDTYMVEVADTSDSKNKDEDNNLSILNEKMQSLIDRIQHAFEVEQVYKDADLTLQSLAQKLNTNRTTLATVLKYKYKMTFKEYLTKCRINKAKEYMLAHPEEPIDIVAEVCGFGGSSNFSHKFKDEVGESPKSWLNARMTEQRLDKK